MTLDFGCLMFDVGWVGGLAGGRKTKQNVSLV